MQHVDTHLGVVPVTFLLEMQDFLSQFLDRSVTSLQFRLQDVVPVGGRLSFAQCALEDANLQTMSVCHTHTLPARSFPARSFPDQSFLAHLKTFLSKKCFPPQNILIKRYESGGKSVPKVLATKMANLAEVHDGNGVENI